MAVAAVSAFPILPDSDVPMLACSVCGGNPISAPEGSTERTRFVCRTCCARISRQRNETECREFVEKRRRLAALSAAALRVRRMLKRGQLAMRSS